MPHARLRSRSLLWSADFSLSPAGCCEAGKPQAGGAAERPTSERGRVVGTLLADESVKLRPPSAGCAEHIRFRERPPVAAGQVPITLDAARPCAWVTRTGAMVEANDAPSSGRRTQSEPACGERACEPLRGGPEVTCCQRAGGTAVRDALAPASVLRLRPVPMRFAIPHLAGRRRAQPVTAPPQPHAV